MPGRSTLVGIAGPSCAGKGEICAWLGRELEAAVLSLDSYYLPLDHLAAEERARCNFDEPAALDEELLVAQLGQLAAGEAVAQPEYDFARHTRGARSALLEPRAFVLVEGLFTLHWPRVRELLAASIFVTAPDEVCLARRLERDQRERGRSAESVLRQYESTVRPMRRMWVDPTERYAGLVLDGCRPVPHNGALALDYVERSVHAAPVAMAAGGGR